MSNLAAKAKNKRRTSQAAIDELSKPDNYLDDPVTNQRFDIDKRLHKALKGLASSTENIENENGEVKVKTVSMRMLLTEATIDLLNKYQAGNGQYPFEEGEDNWSWK